MVLRVSSAVVTVAAVGVAENQKMNPNKVVTEITVVKLAILTLHEKNQ